MTEIRTAAEATGNALDHLAEALDQVRWAMEHVACAEDGLYGYRIRDGRAARRLRDALDAIQSRIDDLDPGPDDQGDEPVDLASPPAPVKCSCGQTAVYQPGLGYWCMGCQRHART